MKGPAHRALSSRCVADDIGSRLHRLGHGHLIGPPCVVPAHAPGTLRGRVRDPRLARPTQAPTQAQEGERQQPATTTGPTPPTAGRPPKANPARPGGGAGVGHVSRRPPTVLALATAIGLLTALVQALGLVRWPFAVPHLACLAGDPAATPARDAVESSSRASTASWAWPSVST